MTRAFREGNLVPIRQSPTAAELDEALALLNAYMLSQFTLAVGDKLREWQVPRVQYTADVNRVYPFQPGADLPLVPTYNTLVPDNSRIVWDGSEQHIYLAAKPQDGALVATALGSGAAIATYGTLTIDGNGRRIGADDTVEIERDDFTPARWFYRADLAQWQAIAPLALTDAMIFPDEFDDLWVCAAAIRLAPRYGKTVALATAERRTEMQLLLSTRYFQTFNTGSGGPQLPQGAQSFGQTGNWMTR